MHEGPAQAAPSSDSRTPLWRQRRPTSGGEAYASCWDAVVARCCGDEYRNMWKLRRVMPERDGSSGWSADFGLRMNASVKRIEKGVKKLSSLVHEVVQTTIPMYNKCVEALKAEGVSTKDKTSFLMASLHRFEPMFEDVMGAATEEYGLIVKADGGGDSKSWRRFGKLLSVVSLIIAIVFGLAYVEFIRRVFLPWCYYYKPGGEWPLIETVVIKWVGFFVVLSFVYFQLMTWLFRRWLFNRLCIDKHIRRNNLKWNVEFISWRKLMMMAILAIFDFREKSELVRGENIDDLVELDRRILALLKFRLRTIYGRLPDKARVWLQMREYGKEVSKVDLEGDEEAEEAEWLSSRLAECRYDPPL